MLPSEAIARYRSGATISEIALTYGLSEDAVRAALAPRVVSPRGAAARTRKRTQSELRYRALASRLGVVFGRAHGLADGFGCRSDGVELRDLRASRLATSDVLLKSRSSRGRRAVASVMATRYEAT